MNTVRQPDPTEKKRCPKCFNTQEIRDGGPSLRGFRAYDLMTDTWGVLRCPACGFRGGAAEFRKQR
jgi:DNA-directed RNA polymerase subunit RPC12/RpoP